MNETDTNLTIIDWISIISAGITIIGFALTVWQLCLISNVKKQVKDARNDTKERMDGILNISTLSSIIIKIEHLQTHLTSKNWEVSLLFMQEIHKCIINISTNPIAEEVTRDDFTEARQRLVSDLDTLRAIVSGDEANTDMRFIQKNLQTIIDNLQLIVITLKNKSI